MVGVGWSSLSGIAVAGLAGVTGLIGWAGVGEAG